MGKVRDGTTPWSVCPRYRSARKDALDLRLLSKISTFRRPLTEAGNPNIRRTLHRVNHPTGLCGVACRGERPRGRKADSPSGSLALQKPLRVDGRHAARAGGGDGLAVNVVLDIPAGEGSIHARGGSVFGDDIAPFVELQLSGKVFRVGLMTNGHKDAVAIEISSFSCDRRPC